MAGLGVVLLIGFYAFKQALVSPDINMIAPRAPIVEATCGLTSIELTTPCRDSLFSSAVFTCADQSVINTGPSTKCISSKEWYDIAAVKCAGKCVAKSTSTPTPSAPLASGCKIVQTACAKMVCPEGQICPPDPNNCKSTVVCDTSTPTPKPSSTPLASGCFAKQVQCIQAPCEPVIVCNTTSGEPPSPEICTQEAGSCVGKTSDGACVTYTDGCQKSSLCASPFAACRQMQKR